MFKNAFQSYQNAYRGLSRDTWILSFVILVNRSGSMVLFFMTLYLTQELNFSISNAGKMISIYGVGSLVGTYLGGWLSDIYGPKRIQVTTLLVSGILFIALSFLEAPVSIAIMLFFLAMIGEAFRPANSTAVAQTSKLEVRARSFALQRLAVNFGVAIGPAVGGLLATINYKYIFWVDGLTCIVAGILLIFMFHPPVKDAAVTEKSNETSDRNPWLDLHFMIILFFVFLSGVVFVQIFNTWPLYLKEFSGLIESSIGSLLAINAALIVLFEMPLIHKIERFNHLRIIAFGAVLLCGGFGLLPAGNGYLFVLFTVLIWTVGEMLMFPMITGFISTRAEGKNLGKYMGLFNVSFSLSFVVGPILGTWIYEKVDPNLLWLLIAVFGLIMAAGFLLLDKYIKKIALNCPIA